MSARYEAAAIGNALVETCRQFTSEAGTSDELEFDAFELLQSVAEGFLRGDIALSITRVITQAPAESDED